MTRLPAVVAATVVAVSGVLAGCGEDPAAASPLERCISDAAEALNSLEVGPDGSFVDSEVLATPGTDSAADDDCDSELWASGLSDEEILDRIAAELDDEHRQAFEKLQVP